jgi:hypothetical protein
VPLISNPEFDEIVGTRKPEVKKNPEEEEEEQQQPNPDNNNAMKVMESDRRLLWLVVVVPTDVDIGRISISFSSGGWFSSSGTLFLALLTHSQHS